MHAVTLLLLPVVCYAFNGRRLRAHGVKGKRLTSAISPKPGDKAASNDFYERLGLSREATQEDIKKNYKKAAFKWHPDKHIEKNKKKHAEEMFKNVAQAYEALVDPEMRRRYDLGGAEALRDSQNGGGDSFGGGGNPFGVGGMSPEQAQQIFSMFSGGGADPFGGAGGMFGNLFGSQFSPPGNRFGSHPGRQHSHKELPHVLPPGTRVVLRSFVNSQHLNGLAGEVVGFDSDKRKYVVQVNNEQKYMKRQNLLQQCPVEIVDLKTTHQLNGASAKVNHLSENGRYVVEVNNAGSEVSFPALRRGNCLLEPLTRVVLEGLSNPKFNGQGAQIVAVDKSEKRYKVKCEDNTVISVRYEKVVC